MHWTSQVIINIMYFTVSGVFSTFHLLALPHKYTRNAYTVNYPTPTATYLFRALFANFGDICYESLGIAPPYILSLVHKSSIFELWIQRFNSVCLMLIN